jgi:MFS family permease
VPNLPAARICVLIIFFIHGAVFSTWISRIPAVQGELGLSTGRFGFALLGVAVGSIISMPVAGWLISRYGSKPVTAISSLWFCLALAPPSLANSALALGCSLAILGLAAGAMDVSMNAQGVVVERIAQRPLMSGFHAAFSIGGMAGAAAGGVIAKAGVDVRTHFFCAAVFYFAIVVAAIRGLLPASADAQSGQHGFRLTPVVLGLGAICFCFFLSEGAVADWSALYLMRGLHAGPAEAAAGYALFSGAMAMGRMAGDSLRARFGPVFLVRNGSLLAASGLAIALLFARTPWALAGFTMVGFGCSIIVPIAFAAAGNLTESAGGALATVVTAGYFGLFVGPPLIGMVAEAITLRWALLIVVGLCLTGVALAPLVGRRGG